MQMIPVESSNLAAVGYEGTLLRVKFRDGSVFDYEDVSPETHAELMTGQSAGTTIGKRLGVLRCQGKILKGVLLPADNQVVDIPRGPGSDEQVTYEGWCLEHKCSRVACGCGMKSPLLHSTVSDSECCRPLFNHAANGNILDGLHEWNCPECDTKFTGTDVSPTVRHWKAEESFLLIRRK